MRSLLDVRLGDPVPQILHVPPDVASLAAAEETIELADAYLICDGNPLAESQKITLRTALGERADGSWAASRVADFGPRQGTGKNDKINARELAGLILFGERLIIHTAHEFPTANEAFLRMVAVFDAWDDLRKKVARIRYANGEQGIELLSGQRLKYRARTGGSGRGFAKADLIVYDEAQHLQPEHVAASGPAKLANPNSQSWYAGSGGLSTSKVAWALRRAALHGNAGRLAYTEKTGETVRMERGRIVQLAPDPDDREVWYSAMPGLGRWVTEEGVEALRDELGELFPREGLCVWEPELGADGEWAIPAQAWLLAADDNSTVGDQVFALEVSEDRAWSTFAAAGRSGEKVHAEVVDTRRGTAWVVERAVELVGKWGGPLAVAKGSPAVSLVDDLLARNVEVALLTREEQASACGRLYDAVMDGRFVHRNQPVLDIALQGAVKRDIGEAWVWSQKKSTVDISPLVALTWATWLHTRREEASVYSDREMVVL
jgi:hypothetical protein